MLIKHENALKQRSLTMVRMRPLDVSIVGQVIYNVYHLLTNLQKKNFMTSISRG